MDKKLNQIVEAIYDLTPLQKGMLYYNMMDQESTAYVLQNVLKIHGKFQSGPMKSSFKLLTQKYEVLRTLILYRSVDVPKQVVLKEREIEYKVTDLSDYEDTAASEKLQELIHADVKRGFDLEKDTLLRVNIVLMNDDITHMIITNHHICMDGWCTSFILHDILDYYEKLADGITEQSLAQGIDNEKGAVAPYRDFVDYINKQDENEGLMYWENLLQGYDEIAMIEPYEAPEVLEQSSDIAEFTLDAAEAQKARCFVKDFDITLSLLFETAWAVLLMKYNRTNDVVFGKVVSGRQKELKGIEKAVGLYINTIPVRFTAKDGVTVKELLQEAFKHEVDSFPYDHCSLSEIQQRTKLSDNLIDSIFVFENYYIQYEYEDKMSFADLTYEIVSAREQTNYPLSVGAFEAGEQIKFGIMYDKSKFTKENVKNLCMQLEKIVKGMILNPEAIVQDINLITEYEENEIIHKFNKQPKMDCGNDTIVGLFEESAKRCADHIAIKYKDQQVTYDRLNSMSNQIAGYLRDMGVTPEDFVVIIGRKSLEMVAGILGIIKSGGCYIPIDADEPQERLEYKLKDCTPKAILIQDSRIKVNTDRPVIDLSRFEFQEGTVANPVHTAVPENLVYVIYTSGTTGNPKGVMIEHKSAVNFCKAMADEYEIHSTDSLILFASITFDASIGQIFLALMTGAMLYIPDPELSSDPDYIHAVAEKEKLSVLSFPPQFAGQLPELECRYVLTAGSEANREVVQKITAYTDYINAYGPTEATICATYWTCRRGDKLPAKIPIGKPHRNYTAYILERGSLCGIGVPGELAIGGVGLSRGYLNRKELTEEKFIKNPFGEGRLYLTGDLARWLADGNIEYLGRMDDQVKIRGYRIELGEVEEALRKTDGVEDTTAIVIDNNYGEQCIAAYVVSKEKLDLSKVRQSIAGYVPSYMIPDYITQIESIPVTINGKVDKTELCRKIKFSASEYEAPQNEIEERICNVFERILGVEKIGVNDRFIDYGGNSINAIRLAALLNKENIRISISDAVSAQTPKRIAEFMMAREKQQDIDLCRKVEPVKLTIIQSMYSRLTNPFSAVLLTHEKTMKRETADAALEELIRLHPVLGYKIEKDSDSMVKDSSVSRCRIAEYDTDNMAEIYDTDIYSAFLLQDREKPLSAILIKGKSKYYILLAFNKVFMDEYTKLVVIDEFINYYNEFEANSDFIHRDSRKEAEHDFIDWASADQRKKGGIVYRQLDCCYTCDAADDISAGMLKLEDLRENIQVILGEALYEYKKSMVKIAYVGECAEHSVTRARSAGQYTVIDLLDEGAATDAAFSILYEDGCEFRARNSGFELSVIDNRTVAGIADIHFDFIIRGGSIKIRCYTGQNSAKKSGEKMVGTVLKYMEKHVYPLGKTKRPVIDETMIKDCFFNSTDMESFCVEKEYSVLPRQKLFLKSDFNCVCVSKIVVPGFFPKKYLEEKLQRIIEHQSVFRSVFDDSFTSVMELQFTDSIHIPYFDLSAQNMNEKLDILSQIEKAGTDVSRFTGGIPLAAQCMVKISEDMSVLYLFAHHTVCDMISLQIWNKEIRNCIYHQALFEDKLRYSDFIPEHGTKLFQNNAKDNMSEYTKRLGCVENNMEISIVSRRSDVREKIESAPAEFLLCILDGIFGIYDQSYLGDIPFLFVHHGRNRENESVMGLFIDVFKFVYRRGDEDSIRSASKALSNIQESGEKINIMNQSDSDIMSYLNCPLLNIVGAQIDYVPEILKSMIASDGKKKSELEFQGVSMELQFFNDAVKLMLKCSKKYEADILSLCAAKFDQNAIVE